MDFSRLRSSMGVVSTAVLIWAVACARSPEPAPRAVFDPPATRGYVLISIDTLSALHLGAYGYERPTSPFIDRLSRRAVVFDQAWVQYPATLISHMSLFTGLYPREHGVIPPATMLSPAIATLPERLQAHGFRTAAFTEGGWVARGFGFERGFDLYEVEQHQGEAEQVERTFARGLEFLRSLDPEDRFFLFLHTYSVHDPYRPPEPYDRMFWDGPPPAGAFPPEGELLSEANRGFREIDAETASYFHALYDGGIRYFDSVLEELFLELERMGLTEETTIILTSDHGEEFGQHGRLAHEQVYPELGRVPLLFLFPGLEEEVRIPEPVEWIDVPLTVLELAGVDPLEEVSGTSQVPAMRGVVAPDPKAYMEVRIPASSVCQAALVDGEGGETLLMVRVFLCKSDPSGHWITRETTFDLREPHLDLRILSFHTPREVEVLVDGEPFERLTAPLAWKRIDLPLPNEEPVRRVTLRAPSCDSPARLGTGTDPRCLSFKIDGSGYARNELYDLAADPWAQRDLSRQDPKRLRSSLRALAGFTLRTAMAPAVAGELDSETERTLRAMGYLD